MQIYYVCDNEGPALLDLETLIGNFRISETPVDLAALYEDVEGRGWYRSSHDNGEYLVLNIDKLKLTLTPDGWDNPQIYPQGNKR